MFCVLESPSWGKRLRMSRFVQLRKMSFEKAKPDPAPNEEMRHKTFIILLRSGMFSVAKFVPDGFGGFVWEYPIHPIEWLGGEGIWMPGEVVAWKERLICG